MWELDCEESWVPKNWCFWIVVLEKTLESPLDCKEMQPVHSEGDQSWVFIGRTDAKAETLILAHLMRRVDSLEKTLILGRIGGKRRRVWQGWDGWMTSLTRWTWVWVNSRSWWWTGRPGVLWFMGSQGVRYDWVTELNWRFLFREAPICFLVAQTVKLIPAMWETWVGSLGGEEPLEKEMLNHSSTLA